MNKEKRLFFAVNIPTDVRERVAGLLEGIPAEKWRKVRPENLHITILFLGNIQESKVSGLQEQCREALEGINSFEAVLNGIGHFGNRVLWLGTGKGTDELNHLSKRVSEAVGVHGQKFHAHITLARNKGSSPSETNGLIGQLGEKGIEEKISVKSIELMESVLHKAGAEYSTVFSQGLGNPQ